MKEQFRSAIQACNLNFLIGSGLSRPFLPTLGDVESMLTALADRKDLSEETETVIRASIYKQYFDQVIQPNIRVLDDESSCHEVRDNYRDFLKGLNLVLLKRKLTLLGKEANLFTTNIDIFLDKSLEDLNLEYNDGFNGRFRPAFSLTNFKKSHYKRSLHFDNTSEIPVFNLLKLHGSLSWAIAGTDLGDKAVVFSPLLAHVREVEGVALPGESIVAVPPDATLDKLIELAADKKPSAATELFLSRYEQLLVIVNPTKEKFKHTLTNETYYELLRLYSNELEKENTVLFAMGFSFADEHIRDITLRAAASNPTLIIYVFAHSEGAKVDIQGKFGKNTIKNDNIIVLAPPDVAKNIKEFDFATITRELFRAIVDDGDEGGQPEMTEGGDTQSEIGEESANASNKP